MARRGSDEAANWVCRMSNSNEQMYQIMRYDKEHQTLQESTNRQKPQSSASYNEVCI